MRPTSMKGDFVQIVFYCLTAVTFIYLLIAGILYGQQSRFILSPTQGLKTNPKQRGYDYEDVWLNIPGKNDRIHGWWIPDENTQAPVLLYLHGNGGTISYFSYLIPLWRSLGLTIFMIDYRGYGLSNSDRFPHEKSLYEDARIALDYLLNDRQISPERIIVYGFSLGGAIAVELLTHPPVKLGGIVLEGTFTSIRKMAALASQGSWIKFNWFPLDLLLHQRFDTDTKIDRLCSPVLFIHGTDDRTIPFSMSETLFDLAPEPKYLSLIPGADHLNLVEVKSDRYLNSLEAFIRTHFPSVRGLSTESEKN